MSKLDCQKKLAKLDEGREVVYFWMADLILWGRQLAANLKKAADNMDDAAALKELEQRLVEIHKFADPSILEDLIDSWEADAQKFRQEVLDAVLDKVKRDKNQKELATTCVPIKDYVEASQSEIKAGRAVIAMMRIFFKFAESFAKGLRQRAGTP